MAGWAGFSDEDLRRLKHGSAGDAEVATRKTVHLKRQRQQTHNRLGPSKIPDNAASNNEKPLDPSQRLSRPSETSVKVNGTKSKEPGPHVDRENNLIGKGKDAELGSNVSESKQQNPAVTASKDTDKDKEQETTARELDENEVLSVELGNIDKFQKQQKVIEEANKQKKQYLSKAINERKKKAKAESVKLTKIQVELSHLDTLLSVDIGVIRDKIEMASIEYVEAQRRYNKAEQEFINAKMSLFDKGELKERLTEHLYTIIHQNEVRKANKLAELMKQLEMEVEQDELDLVTPSIPILTNFNSVTTLHNPAHKHHITGHSEVTKPTEPTDKDSSKHPTDSEHKGENPAADDQKKESLGKGDNSSQSVAQSGGDNLDVSVKSEVDNSSQVSEPSGVGVSGEEIEKPACSDAGSSKNDGAKDASGGQTADSTVVSESDANVQT